MKQFNKELFNGTKLQRFYHNNLHWIEYWIVLLNIVFFYWTFNFIIEHWKWKFLNWIEIEIELNWIENLLKISIIIMTH